MSLAHRHLKSAPVRPSGRHVRLQAAGLAHVEALLHPLLFSASLPATMACAHACAEQDRLQWLQVEGLVP